MSTPSKFQRAERRRVKLKIAITGPSGSGKTYSALELASGLGQKIALIDTENDSASLYSDRFVFDTLVIDPPYTIQKYVEAIKAAEEEKYDVLVIDSISHAWAGDGGLLSKKEMLDARGGNSYTNWGGITKEHEQFKGMLLTADLHLICTMRSKQDYVLEISDKGKSAPKKVGLAPIQRDGMEYEFTTVFDVAMDHNAAASKDRSGLFDGQMFKIGKDTGERFTAWLGGATAEARKATAHEAPVAAQTRPTLVEEDPGAYVMKLGKEYRGQRLDTIDMSRLYGFSQWLEGKGKEDPVKFAKDQLAQETLTAIEKFLLDRQYAPGTQEGA